MAKKLSFFFSIFQTAWLTGTYWKIIPLILISSGYTAVASFIILTAYGLSKRYQSDPLIFIPYFKRRLEYLFIPWLVISLWIELLMAHPPTLENWFLIFSTLKIWIPHHQYLLLGPWWFLAMIFQVYLIFPALLSAYKKWGHLFLLALCLIQYLSQVLINPFTESFGLNLNITPIAALIPISVGLFWASQKSIQRKNKIHPYGVLTGGVLVFLFFMAQTSFYTWPFANTLLGIVLLGLGYLCLPSKISPWLKHLTTLIVPVYLTHGYIYPFFRQYLDQPNSHFWIYGVCLISVLAITYMCAVLIREITRIISQEIPGLFKIT